MSGRLRRVHLHGSVVYQDEWFELAREVGTERPFLAFPMQSGFATFNVCLPISEEQYALFQAQPILGEEFTRPLHGKLYGDLKKLGFYEPVFDD